MEFSPFKPAQDQTPAKDPRPFAEKLLVIGMKRSPVVSLDGTSVIACLDALGIGGAQIGALFTDVTDGVNLESPEESADLSR